MQTFSNNQRFPMVSSNCKRDSLLQVFVKEKLKKEELPPPQLFSKLYMSIYTDSFLAIHTSF